MADGEVRAQDLAQETASTLSGNEQFVMFDSTAGKRADIDDVATYVAGDKTTLKTTNKTSPVAAINENFDAIADVKEDIDDLKNTLFYAITNENLWESGNISSSDGGNTSTGADIRLRTKTFLGQEVDSIVPESGYKYIIFAYNTSGSYIGCYNGSSFPKSATWFTREVNLRALPNTYVYKLVLAKANDGSISVADSENCAFMAHVDATLSISGVAADAKETGNRIAEINNTIESIGAEPMNLFDSSHLENGCYYSGGSRHTASNFSASDYIQIKGSGTYCVARYTENGKALYTPIIEWYNESKTYIGWSNNKNIITFPSIAKYCRISSLTADLRGKQIVFLEATSLAEMPDEWIPHDVDIKDVEKINMPNYQYACGDIICVGDSLTDGLYVPISTGLIKQNYPYYLQRMLNAELVNAGVNGAPCDTWYNTQFSRYNYADYDTAIIWLGTNGGLDIADIGTSGTQCYYYKQIIDGIKSQNPTIKIILATVFITGQAHSESTWPNVTTTNTAIQTIATNGGYQVIDMSDLGYANHPELHNNTNNTHFGKAGNIYIANRICENLKEYFDKNPLRCEFGIMPKA